MKKFLYTLILVMMTFAVQGQTIPKDIVDGFMKGDARKIASYFHNNLEMQILDESHVTSKNQATRILQDFFKKYPPKDFKVNYEGTEQDSKYGHSTLTTKKGSFRVNIYFMEGKPGKTIYSLSIEKI